VPDLPAARQFQRGKGKKRQKRKEKIPADGIDGINVLSQILSSTKEQLDRNFDGRFILRASK
jgi:hypothetical protein